MLTLRSSLLATFFVIVGELLFCCVSYAQTPAGNVLQNASFQSSSAGWRANNLASAVSLAQYKSSHYPAPFFSYDGSGFLEMNTSQPEGSVAQDVTVFPQPGQSYSFSVWLRAAPGVNSVSGSVTLWG